MHSSLEIRLGRKNIAKKQGCEIITIEDIDSVPIPHTFIEADINKKIQEEARNTLKFAMSDRKYQYGEVAILFSTLDNTVHEKYEGEFHRVEFKDTNLHSVTVNRTTIDLILVHNHPNNSCFSGADIITLCSNMTMLAIVAVGNTQSMYILLKSFPSKNNAAQYVIKRAEQLRQQANDTVDNIKKYKDMAAIEVLKNPGNYGLSYERYNRRHVK